MEPGADRLSSSDFWALGCLIYQMIAGRFAFQGLSEFLTFQKIKQLEYTFPEGFDVQAQDLIQRLLVRSNAMAMSFCICKLKVVVHRYAILPSVSALALPEPVMIC